MKLKHILVLAALGAVGVQKVQAQDSGCGAGGYIIQKNSKVLQLLAVTTNHSFLSQEFGITSGTSGCSASGIVMNDRAAEYFAEVNLKDITREMAQGKGEKLSAFTALYGCSVKGQKDLSDVLQKDFDQYVSHSEISAKELVQNVHQGIKSNPELSKECVSIASR